ncbi:MAG: hypothetical protein H8D56_27015 [Planctomycetes bacterium]|nr:hypothetical protein [Planctomycetota bacterium]MBL7153732.1 hypothetical protein [Phycisphaerae bacterium]
MMLDAGGVLQTYRLDLPPEFALGGLGRPCTATRIQDHPLRFLEYEGSVNKGLGSVRIVDSGRYQLLDDGTESFLLDFDGEALTGQFRLAHIEGNEWQFKRIAQS